MKEPREQTTWSKDYKTGNNARVGSSAHMERETEDDLQCVEKEAY